MATTTRPASVDDAEPVAALHVRAWRGGYDGIMPGTVLAGVDAAAWAPRRRQWIGAVEWINIVAADGDEIVGFVDCGPHRRGQDWADLDPAVGEVYAIYVDPPRWGSGAGRILMDAAVAALAKTG